MCLVDCLEIRQAIYIEYCQRYTSTVDVLCRAI